MNDLKFSFIWNFHITKRVVLNLTSFGTLKYDCDRNIKFSTSNKQFSHHWI